jgi:alkyl hydroperoxide reductase subunit AhpF
MIDNKDVLESRFHAHCVDCYWKGLIGEATLRLNDVARCPHCQNPLRLKNNRMVMVSEEFLETV